MDKRTYAALLLASMKSFAITPSERWATGNWPFTDWTRTETATNTNVAYTTMKHDTRHHTINTAMAPRDLWTYNNSLTTPKELSR